MAGCPDFRAIGSADIQILVGATAAVADHERYFAYAK